MALNFLYLQAHERLLPFRFLKADQNQVAADQQWPFDEHAVAGKQCDLLLIRHLWQLVFQPQIAVGGAADVKKAPQRQAAELLPIL